MNCSIFDEDLVCDALEPLLESGGHAVDFHSVGFFPDDWFDLVVVLRADTEVLSDRLESRHYPESKIKENLEAEIFQVCLDEAREAFEEADGVEVVELQHNDLDELREGVARVQEFVSTWRG